MYGGLKNVSFIVAASCVLVSCGGDRGESEGDASNSGLTMSGSATDSTVGTSQGSDSDSASSGATDSATASASGTASATASATATDSATGTAGSASASASATVGPKFDVGGDTTGVATTGGDCECGSQLDFSYIWIANSGADSSVSKLNTQTMMEEGRFITHPLQAGSPSRTSVSISGLAVAVANRNGGVVKVWADDSQCDPNKNGQPGIQTSTDLNYLPWGQDDCVAWFTDFAYTTQRPVAWAPGILDPISCTYSEEKVWTAGCNTGGDTWVTVSRLNGDTGVVEDQVLANGFECSSLSPYGGAVDAAGNFWFTNLVPSNDRLARVDAVTLQVDVQTPPITPYGMTVDSKGRVWLAAWTGADGVSGARYTPALDQWDLAIGPVASVMSGIQEDALGRMWMNYWTYSVGNPAPGLTYIDAETMQVGPAYPIGCNPSSCRGLSIDLDGNVWSTAQSMNTAFRFNPDNLQVDTYGLLAQPYTYSDMTGWAVQNAGCGPEG